MKLPAIMLTACMLALVSCQTAVPLSVEEIALTRIAETAAVAGSEPEATDTPPATSTPQPTSTFAPTPTLRPTQTPQPTWEPVDIDEVEQALQDAGYRRFPFSNTDGDSGFFWNRTNPYESVTTWDDGTIRLQVLHNDTRADRAARMEPHLEAMDSALPLGFMEELRREHIAYNRAVPASVSGEPDWIYSSNDEWNTVLADYFTEDFGRGRYGASLALRFWQSTCPPRYDYCYYNDFPGLEFTGDSSFVFYTIWIYLP